MTEWGDLALDRADELDYPGKTCFTVCFYLPLNKPSLLSPAVWCLVSARREACR